MDNQHLVYRQVVKEGERYNREQERRAEWVHVCIYAYMYVCTDVRNQIIRSMN
jgi:hypothetical protein